MVSTDLSSWSFISRDSAGWKTGTDKGVLLIAELEKVRPIKCKLMKLLKGVPRSWDN